MKNILENRLFKLWVYTVSHRCLLIRSEKQYPDIEYPSKYEPNFTLDIEFWGVLHINIPVSFNGLSIIHNKEYDTEELKKLSKNEDLKYFELYDGNNKYFIIAAGCIVGKSNWDRENRLSNPELEYEEIILQM